jgi:outer membrane protein TolC
MHSGCLQRQPQTAPPGQQLNDWVKQAEAANYGALASQLNVDITQSSYRGSLAANYPIVKFVDTTGFNAASGSATNFNPSTM